MIKKKICMLGSFAVGKTSLIQKFVTGIFSEKYFTTIGVKIDKKTIITESNQVELLLWDIYGEDKFQKVESSYLRGSSGYLLVIDGTRKETLDVALQLKERVEKSIGNIPFIVIINKSDLKDNWEIELDKVKKAFADKATVIESSAKTGENVESIFEIITKKVLG
ncbi:MAG: GTP-binding protein [Candidatus Cloacimonetes bacterium]|nr:GTP-binding protein [Candidatus Cloacimonadota bacterium]